MNKSFAIAALTIVAGIGLPGGAVFAADTAAGRRTADTWCVGCHLVGSEQKAALADAPTFPEIAARMSPDAIRAFLFNPHPPMPQFRLTARDIEDLAAFIATTKK